MYLLAHMSLFCLVLLAVLSTASFRMQRKTVVFVGGGYAATKAIKRLLKRSINAQLVLIDPKDGFFHSVGSPRALVDPRFAEQCFQPYLSCFPANTVVFVQGKVTAVRARSVMVSTGNEDREMPFDVCVLATGRTYAFPYRLALRDDLPAQWTSASQLMLMTQQREELVAAERVFVVGGGATGVETAGEVKTAFPNKRVMLVHSKGRLLNRQREVSVRDAEKIKRQLEEKGIEVVLNTQYHAAAPDPATFVVMATGGVPNTDFLRGDACLNNGLVLTDQFLRVRGRPNVFAMGDIVADCEPTIKTATYLHAPVIAANVRALVSGLLPKNQLGRFPAMVDSFLVLPFGPKEGYSHGMLGKMIEPQYRRDYLMKRKAKELATEEQK